MVAVKRALLFSTADRYFALLIGFATVAAVSRILTPGEIGISVIAAAVVGIAMSAREFTSGSYLIQRTELSCEMVRSAFTVMAALNAAVALTIAAAAPLIAHMSNEDRLIPYLRVISLALFIETLPSLVVTLLRRDMAFRKVAAINASSAIAVSAATVGLALLGFSFMSFAWAWLAAAVVTCAVAVFICPYFWMFKPSLHYWREMVSFGGYNGATVVLYRISEATPYLFLGRLVSPEASALLQRATMLCTIPDKVILGGAAAVVLPAFATETRQGRALKDPYLKALALITALQWPALAVLALLAHPLVNLLLGQQWHDVVPLVRIIAIAMMFTFSFELNYPVLVSMGAVRAVFLRAIIVFPLTAAILAAASLLGLEAVAWGFMVAVPLNALVSLQVVRRRIGMEWKDIAAATARSAVVTGSTALGPIAVAAAARFDLAMSSGQAAAAVLLAATGWIAALWATGHPLFAEIRGMIPVLRQAAQRG